MYILKMFIGLQRIRGCIWKRPNKNGHPCSRLQEGRLRSKCDGTRTETRFRFSAKRTVHLNRWRRQFSRLLAAEVCASAVVMLDTPSSEVVWRVLATHSIRQFSLHFPFRASPCANTFQLDSTKMTVPYSATSQISGKDEATYKCG